MTENDSAGGGAAPTVAGTAAQEGDQAQTVTLNVVGQYVKDLSFEVPNAPGIFETLRNTPPEISLNVDVSAQRAVNQDIYLVGIKVDASAKGNNETAFVLELEYYGVFNVRAPAQHIEPLLLIECPRLLFPFVRNIIADTTREGGFVPLMMQPLDFAALYRQKLEQRKAEQGDQPVV